MEHSFPILPKLACLIPGAVTALALADLAAAGALAKDAAKNPVAPPEKKSPFTFDFQERLRFEARDNTFDFNDGFDALTDDSWLLQRARVGIGYAPTDFLRLYVQGQSSLELGSDRPKEPGVMGAEGDDAIDLRQAFFSLGSETFHLTLGRQALNYGEQRLVGESDWGNFGRVFDAAKLRYQADNWSLDAFASSVVAPDRHSFDRSDLFDGNDTGRNQVFSGLYFSTTLLPAQTTDLYAFQLHEEAAAGDTDFVTLGLRLKADVAQTGGFDYETEMAAQFGQVKGRDLSAFAGHWGVGYVWTEAAWKPRLFLEYNYATGDSDATDGKVGTFQNLFPTNHKFYGFMDAFSWQNIHNPAVSFSTQPAKGVTMRLDYHAFWLADTADAWYRANGTAAVRPVTPDADRFAGTELDVTVSWKANQHFTLLAGYSHFFAGSYLDDTGAGDDADFAYVQATFDF